jgi:hypothetical protein
MDMLCISAKDSVLKNYRYCKLITRKPFWVFCCIPTSLQILNLCLRTAMGGNNVIPEKTRMAPSKIAITIDDKVLKQIDMLVESKYFPNRSKAIFFKE